MAHSFDTSVRFTGTGAPLEQAYTCGTGATLLVLGIVVNLNTAVRSGGAPTYDGVEMKQAGIARVATETICEMWYMLAPPTGSEKTISIPNTGTARTLYVCASSYKAQTGYSSFPDVAASAVATAADPALTLTPSVAGDVLVAVCGDGYNTAPTNRSHTKLYETDNGASSDNHQYALVADTSATTVGWTVASDDYCIIVAAFQEVPATVLFVGPTADTYLAQSSVGTNYDTSDDFRIRAAGTSAVQRCLLKFDVSTIPAGATVTVASLRLWDKTPTSGATLTMSRLVRSDYVSSEATWTVFKSGSNWGTAGALNVATDFTETDQASASSPDAAAWVSWDILEQVKTAIASVGGIVLLVGGDPAPAGGKSQIFASQASVDKFLVPRLYIEYVTFIPQCVFL